MKLGPALNGLEHRALRHVPRHGSVRTRHVVEQTGEDFATVHRVLRELVRLGYITQAGGWWRRA